MRVQLSVAGGPTRAKRGTTKVLMVAAQRLLDAADSPLVGPELYLYRFDPDTGERVYEQDAQGAIQARPVTLIVDSGADAKYRYDWHIPEDAPDGTRVAEWRAKHNGVDLGPVTEYVDVVAGEDVLDTEFIGA